MSGYLPTLSCEAPLDPDRQDIAGQSPDVSGRAFPDPDPDRQDTPL